MIPLHPDFKSAVKIYNNNDPYILTIQILPNILKIQ